MARKKVRLTSLALAALALLGWGAVAGLMHAETPADPSAVPPPAETAPDPAAPRSEAEEEGARLSRIEAQLSALDSRNRQLQKDYDLLKRRYQRVNAEDPARVFSPGAKNPDGAGIPGGVELGPDAPSRGGEEGEDGEGEGEGRPAAGEAVAGRGGPQRAGAGTLPGAAQRVPLYRVGLFWFRDNSAEIAGRGPYHPDMPAHEHEVGPGTFLGGRENGVTWMSQDKYWSLTFHNLTQMDLREPFQQGDPLHGGFIIPRQRWYFEGKVGDYVNYVTSINRGYSTLDLLDSYADFIVHPEWLSFRVGRMKTPSQYEYISIDEANLIGPERSIWVQNYAGNRQLGAMAHGRLFNRMFEYYAGAFNGQRRSFEDYNSSRDGFFYLDYRPFINSGVDWLSGLHMVGTYNFGEERQPLSPIALRTFNQLSNSNAAAFVSPTILEFAPNAFENGPHEFYSYETVYYYKSWGFLSGIQGGYQDYSLQPSTSSAATTGAAGTGGGGSNVPTTATAPRINSNNEFLGVNSPFRTHVPTTGWSFQTWYFLTGEEITRRRYLVEPRHPYGYYNGSLHPGAIELFAKVSDLQMGDAIFRGGIANRALWTNRAFAPEVGANWYLTHFVRFTVDYQHVFLGNPVVLDQAAHKFTKDYDMITFRTQLFF